MLALALTNTVGVVLFAVLYATAGARLMSQGAFLACLVLIFALVTGLWVRIESRHRGLPALRRAAQAIGGLAITVIGAPTAALMPAFWLDRQLPAEADFTRNLAPLMTLVLISLVLVVVANVLGATAVCVRGLVGTRR